MGLLDKTGSCDPSPEPYNVIALSKASGQVTVTVKSTWDGVSVWPNCAGPIVDVRLQNTGADTWILNLPNGKKLKNRPILPGTDTTATGAQLVALGVETLADIEDFTLSLAP